MVGIGWARGINNIWVVVILTVLGKRYRMLAPHSRNIAKAAAGSDLPSGNNSDFFIRRESRFSITACRVG
jgi:hypothetical protein